MCMCWVGSYHQHFIFCLRLLGPEKILQTCWVPHRWWNNNTCPTCLTNSLCRLNINVWNVYSFRLCIYLLPLAVTMKTKLFGLGNKAFPGLVLSSLSNSFPSIHPHSLHLCTPDIMPFWSTHGSSKPYYYITPGYFLMSPSLPKMLVVWWHFSHSQSF